MHQKSNGVKTLQKLNYEDGSYNTKYIVSTYYMPDSFLSDLHVLTLPITGLLNELGPVRAQGRKQFHSLPVSFPQFSMMAPQQYIGQIS